jgi:hypothetical protein
MEYFMLSAYFGDFDGKVDSEDNNCIWMLESLNVTPYFQTKNLQMEWRLIKKVTQMVTNIPRMIDNHWNIIKHWQHLVIKTEYFWLKKTC